MKRFICKLWYGRKINIVKLYPRRHAQRKYDIIAVASAVGVPRFKPLAYCRKKQVCTVGRCSVTDGHRRRIYTEAKAKIVASVWGAEFIQFLAALAILNRSICKNRINSTYSSKSTKAEYPAQQGIE